MTCAAIMAYAAMMACAAMTAYAAMMACADMLPALRMHLHCNLR